MTERLADRFTLADFPPVGYQKWRAAVEESLGGAAFEQNLVTHTRDGIDIQPIYCRRDAVGSRDPLGFPGLAPFVRGSRPQGAVLTGWDVRQEHAHPDLQVTNRAIQDDLQGGATSLLLRLDAAARAGLDPDQDASALLAGRDGVMAYCVADLEAALANVDHHKVPVALEAGAAFLPAAALLAALWQRHGLAAEQVRGAFNADPLAALALHGRLPVKPQSALASLAGLAAWTAGQYPHVSAVGVDTGPYDDAGATAAQDIAFGIATAVQYLRAMEDAGLDVDTAARQILFRIGLGTHHFLEVAKLRAARRAWSRVIEASGGSSRAGAMRIHTRTSRRVLTQRDPYVNLLRNTVAVFAAGIGGADIITPAPFDAAAGLPDGFSRRIARNTVLVLQDEAQLHRVIDPAGGSWFLDRLTEQLAGKAWEVFQEVERRGGMLASLESGWVAAQIDAAFAPLGKDIACRKASITGVSEFPDAEPRIVRSAPDPAALRAAAAARLTAIRRDLDELRGAASGTEASAAALVEAAVAGATIGQLARAAGLHQHPSRPIAPIEPRRFAAPFEQLRDASDAWQAAHGQRPRVFLANLGPVAQHAAPATYARSFFETGGFEVIGNQGYDDPAAAAAAFAGSGANIAVICSSDQLCRQLVPRVAPQLKEAGARSVVLAGFPAEEADGWQSAGVDRFIYPECDALETLRELLREDGVLQQHED